MGSGQPRGLVNPSDNVTAPPRSFFLNLSNEIGLSTQDVRMCRRVGFSLQ